MDEQNNVNGQVINNNLQQSNNLNNGLQSVNNMNGGLSPVNNINSGLKQVNNVPINNSYNQPFNNGQQFNVQEPKKKNFNIGCIIIPIILVTIFVVFAIISGKGNQEKKINREQIDRTIMIYMVGTDLESRAHLGSSDITDLINSDIDLENTNILLMVGGSSDFLLQNIDERETSIFKVIKNDLVEVKEISKQNMGNPNTLTTLLKYGYEHYESEKYDLIIWNHGSGILGVGHDELTNDLIDPIELGNALKNSPFNKNNKLETITFRTCLSGNLTFANILDEYANYMIASEETTFGYSGMKLLSFISELESNDNGLEYGKKFIKYYSEAALKIDPKETKQCYSIIDLSKVNEFNKELDKYLAKINVKDNYKKISYIRSNMYTYATDATTGLSYYDTIDLYYFIYMISKSTNINADVLLSSFDDVIVYNWSLNNYSKGLSVYFPYTSHNNIITKSLNLLNQVDKSRSVSFANEFNSLRLGKSSFKMELSTNVGSATKSEFKLQLTKDQMDEYAKASYIVFKDMGDGYYMPLYASNSPTLDRSTGMLSAKLEGKMLKVVDKKDNSEEYIHLIEESVDNGIITYNTNIMLTDVKDKENVNTTIDNAIMTFKVDSINPNGKITKIIKKADNDLPNNILLNLKDYDEVSYLNYKYKILDDNGKYTTNWQSSGVAHIFYTGTDVSEYEFKSTGLDDGYDYYCVFIIKDLQNNAHYSNLIKMQ